MMYNRYVPQPDGSYRRSRAGEPDPPQPHSQKPEPPKPEPREPDPPKPAPCPPPRKQRPDNPARSNRKPRESSMDGFLRQLLPKDFDTGDLMVVLLLLLMAGDSADDRNDAILTLALYFLM